jgi:hypothetical protein
MRAVGQRLQFVILALAAAFAGRAVAQSAPAPDDRPEAAAVEALLSKANETPEEIEEITVEGQRRGNVLGKYRLEMVKARDKIVDVFNDVNSDDSTDVKCRTEKPTGTRMGHSVCRSRAEDAADAAAAKGLLRAMFLGTNLGRTGEEGFTEIKQSISVDATPGTAGGVGAQGEGNGGTGAARERLVAEMKKMMEQNRDLYRATLKYIEVRDEYNKYRETAGSTAE